MTTKTQKSTKKASAKKAAPKVTKAMVDAINGKPKKAGRPRKAKAEPDAMTIPAELDRKNPDVAKKAEAGRRRSASEARAQLAKARKIADKARLAKIKTATIKHRGLAKGTKLDTGEARVVIASVAKHRGSENLKAFVLARHLTPKGKLGKTEFRFTVPNQPMRGWRKKDDAKNAAESFAKTDVIKWIGKQQSNGTPMNDKTFSRWIDENVVSTIREFSA